MPIHLVILMYILVWLFSLLGLVLVIGSNLVGDSPFLFSLMFTIGTGDMVLVLDLSAGLVLIELGTILIDGCIFLSFLSSS